MREELTNGSVCVMFAQGKYDWKLWKVDSEDDFAMCYNMWSTDKNLSRLVHFGSIQYQDKLVETHGLDSNCDTMIPRCSSYQVSC